MSGKRAKMIRRYVAEHWTFGPEHYINGRLMGWSRIVRRAKRAWTRERVLQA